MNIKQKQTTIIKEIILEGVGVHSGKKSILRLKPAASHTGIVIVNPLFPYEPITIGTVIPEHAMHATIVKNNHWGVSTIEHLMAAIHGLGIDNMIIEIEGEEAPILDGSAFPFVQAFIDVGLLEQDAKKQFLTPKETISFENDGRFIEIQPAKENSYALTFDYSVNFEHPLIANSTITCHMTPGYFTQQIAPARTFGFLAQLPMLRKHGLAKGTTLGNTVVIGEDLYLNSLRFKNEFIRHKLLDLLGDLALLGKNLAGTVIARKTGHNFNRLVIEHYVTNPDAWKLIS